MHFYNVRTWRYKLKGVPTDSIRARMTKPIQSDEHSFNSAIAGQVNTVPLAVEIYKTVNETTLLKTSDDIGHISQLVVDADTDGRHTDRIAEQFGSE